MGRIAAKATALDAVIRIGSRVDKVQEEIDLLRKEVWASTKLSASLMDQVNEIQRFKLDTMRELMDRPKYRRVYRKKPKAK